MNFFKSCWFIIADTDTKKGQQELKNLLAEIASAMAYQIVPNTQLCVKVRTKYQWQIHCEFKESHKKKWLEEKLEAWRHPCKVYHLNGNEKIQHSWQVMTTPREKTIVLWQQGESVARDWIPDWERSSEEDPPKKKRRKSSLKTSTK